MNRVEQPILWSEVLATLVSGDDLSRDRVEWAMREILDGNATAAQIAGFAVALRAKGETVEEMTALADEMLAHATVLEVPGRVVDIVGTGGDLAGTVNISSMAAVVVAGCGVGVVKHGNRAASSKSGSADVLEALGVALDVPVGAVLDVFAESGITFCFAPLFHGSFRHVAAPRRELGIPTPFNFLGPLTNPAQPKAAAVGCADARMAPLMAGVFARRGTDAVVLRGEDGLDEVSVAAPTRLWTTRGSKVVESVLDPQDHGFTRAPLESLRGGDAQHNAAVFRDVMQGGEQGPIHDAVVLNAAVALAVHDESDTDLQGRIETGVAAAREALSSGSANDVLTAWSKASQRHRG